MKFYHCLKHKFRSKGQRSILELEEERQSEGYSETPFSLKLDGAKTHNLRVFSFSELRKATRNFNRGLKIGEGGFGSVYKGTIKPDDGKGEPLVVAIKKLKENSSQGQKEWLMEVQFLRVLEHPNIVKLIGHCAVDGERGNQRLLVYEFMPNNSLQDHLFSRVFPPLPWKTRLQIILGAARALAYLHEEFKVQLIHRNINPSNVLLDEKFNPKLSDFGLAREGPMDGDEHVSTQVAGTFGYVAPEYMETGCLTYKCDVWSFGVVLYEILSGRRPIEFTRPTSEKILLQWVKQFPANDIQFIMDPRLENQYSIDAARKIAKLADACLSTSPHERPKMSEVVERLKHIIQVSEEETAEKMQNHPEASEIETDETKKKSDNKVSESLKSQMTHIAEESIQEEDTNELLTIKCALENFLKAKRKGKIVLIVESNSATAVKWIEDIESRPRKLWDMLKEIDSLISETGTVVFKILLKETNVIEDCWVKEEVVRSYKLCAWW